MNDPVASTAAVASQSRRAFIRTSTVGALAAVSFAGTTPRAQATESAQLPHPGSWNVRELGARGDGIADDTGPLLRALEQARAYAGGTVFLPAGIYLVNRTLKLASNVWLVGAGPGLTTIKAAPGTVFEKILPDPRANKFRQRHTLITTEAAGTVRGKVVTDAGLSRLTIDWSHCAVHRYGHSVVLADSCDRFELDHVYFINCLPVDFPRTREE
jgi:hypothetical protein